MSDKSIVINQIDNLSKYFFKYSLINKSNNINCKDDKVGNIIKFNILNYISIYTELVDNKKYHIMLNDNSLICFYYQFDKNEKIIKHCLYYFPSPSEDIYSLFQSKVYNSLNELEVKTVVELSQLLEKYIRIDYDLEGKKEIVHTSVHLHYGLTSDKLRIPIYSKVYPEEFVYFILKYVYESDDKNLESLNLNVSKNAELSELELQRFYLQNTLNAKI